MFHFHINGLGEEQYRSLKREIEALGNLIKVVIHKEDQIMATFAEVKAELDTVKAAVAALPGVIASEKQEVVAKITELETLIQQLRDQIATGTPITQAQLDELAADVAAVKAGVATVGTGVADIITSGGSNPTP